MYLIKNDQIFKKSKDTLNTLNNTFFEVVSRDEQPEYVNLDSGDNISPGILKRIPNETAFSGNYI